MLGRRLGLAQFASASSSLAALTRPSTATVSDVWSRTQVAGVHHHMERHDLKLYLGIKRSNRHKANRNTHVNEKMFRGERAKKTVIVELPDDEIRRRMETMSPSEIRAEMLRRGINPYKEVQPRAWQEHQMTFSSFHSVVDEYVNVEESLPWWQGFSSIKDTSMHKFNEVKDSVMHRLWHNWQNGSKRIKKKEGFEKFDQKTFGATADVIYEEAHKALMARDKAKLHRLITENAFVKMWPDVEQGSIEWELVERLEPSKVVTIRCGDVPYKSGNDIAQITVRMHTRQRLAIFDRFGKLVLGSKTEPKEVVEYVVFENHIAMTDGVWRVHDKVYPRWAKEKEPAIGTTVIEKLEDRPTHAQSLTLRVKEVQKEQMRKYKERRERDGEE